MGVNCLKRETGIVFRFKRRLGKKEGVKFLKGGVETPIHTMSRRFLLIDRNIENKYHCNTEISLIILTIIDA